MARELSSRRCPHPRCRVVIPPLLYACPTHWHALPLDLRRRVVDGAQHHADTGDPLLWRAATKDALRYWHQRGIA